MTGHPKQCVLFIYTAVCTEKGNQRKKKINLDEMADDKSNVNSQENWRWLNCKDEVNFQWAVALHWYKMNFTSFPTVCCYFFRSFYGTSDVPLLIVQIWHILKEWQATAGSQGKMIQIIEYHKIWLWSQAIMDSVQLGMFRHGSKS